MFTLMTFTGNNKLGCMTHLIACHEVVNISLLSFQWQNKPPLLHFLLRSPVGRTASISTYSTWGDSDVILSTIVTGAMLEVYQVAAV